MDYKSIDWYRKNEDDIFDILFHEVTKPEEKFNFFKHLIAHFPKLEIPWLDIFENMKDDLLYAQNTEAYEYFINWYNQKFPDDYQNRYEFVERDLIDYYFFSQDYISLQEHVGFVKRHPISGMDTITVRLLYQLIYHGKYDDAIDFAKGVWKPVSESDELMGAPEHIFVLSLFAQSLQKYYKAVLSETEFDVQAFFTESEEWGFSDDKELQAVIIKAIEHDFDFSFIEKAIHKKEGYHLLHMNMQFLKFMYQQYKMPFIFSEFLWHFVTTNKIFGKHGIDDYFFIDAKTMDKHITERLDIFLGSNELEIFGQVWGFDFIIEFLGHFNLITKEQKQIMIENNLHFKDEVARISGENLWQMDFVFNWPLNITGRDVEKEKHLFHSTFSPDFNDTRSTWPDYNILYPENDRISKELKLHKRNDFFHRAEFLFSPTEPIRNEFKNIGRNDPCPCGSGKKYKKCCLNKE